MTANTHESPIISCYWCWAQKKKCEWDPRMECCIRCNPRRSRCVDTPSSALPFPREAIEKQFREQVSPGVLPPGLPYMDVLCIYFVRSSLDPKLKILSEVPPLVLGIQGTWRHRDHSLVFPFDNLMSQYFSVSLEPNEAQSELIFHAALTGGYLRVLSSTTSVTSGAWTSMDDTSVKVGVFNDQLNRDLRYLFILRLGDLIPPIMTAVRSGDFQSNVQAGSSDTVYAAAAVLHYGIQHAKSGLRTGIFSEALANAQSDFKRRPLLEWLEAVERELKAWLTRRCSKTRAWASVFDAPNKTLRNTGEEIKIIAHFTQAKASSGYRNEPVPFTPRSPSSPQPASPILWHPLQTVSVNPQSHITGIETYLTPPAIISSPPSGTMRDAYPLHRAHWPPSGFNLEPTPEAVFTPHTPGPATEDMWSETATVAPGLLNNMLIGFNWQTSLSHGRLLQTSFQGQNLCYHQPPHVSYFETPDSSQEETYTDLDISFVDPQGHENINYDVDMESLMEDPDFLLSLRGLN